MKETSKAKKTIIKFLLLTLAAGIFAFNLKSFIRTGNLIPGGFSGITVLIQQIGRQFFNVEIPYSLVYLPLNVIPAYIGLRYIGKKFTFESFYVVVLSSILTDIIPNITITYEPILIALFAGIVGGIASVICLTAGASGGGTDFISIFLSEKKGIDAWGYILAGNIVLLVIGGLLFDFDRALYSIIYQYVITTMLGT
ncbi:MAG: YitT family protein [Firmicutes bacterium]|nr:YitT family protein [Bacillota bacterium]